MDKTLSEISPAIRTFLLADVPGGAADLQRWRAECQALGADAPIAFIHALRNGPSRAHYPSVLGLREFGYAAHMEDGESHFIFRIRSPAGKEEVIVPADVSEPEGYVTVIGVKPGPS